MEVGTYDNDCALLHSSLVAIRNSGGMRIVRIVSIELIDHEIIDPNNRVIRSYEYHDKSRY